ncbi:hypothetical protein LJC71_09705 [Desulfosarcina sp. OttesenSCG-928-A07]|nr:hypothetical protein [Desulfosarcina sp. OttesenSCG-928-A07]
MQRKRFIAVFAFAFLPLLCSGCFPQKQAPVEQKKVIPVPEIQYIDATLIEGKTTKQEVLDALGMPESISATSLSYRYGDRNNKNLRARLRIVQKDGTELNVILGDGLKHDSILIHFSGSYDDQGRHTPSNINTGISVH